MPKLATLNHRDQQEVITLLGRGEVSRDDWIAMYDAHMEEFRQADTNRDGMVDRGEWTQHFGDDAGFDAADQDGDGVVNTEEFVHAKHTDAELGALDADGDGKISREEWVTRYGSDKDFDSYDMDGDGVVDADEFRKGRAGDLAFGAADLNHDGKITREEWARKYGTEAGFDEYDINGDGVVDAKEFRKAKAAAIDFNAVHTDRQYEQRSAKVTADEWEARYGSLDGFREYDLDGDGNLDADEYRKCHMAQSELLTTDLNRDGKISRDEWIAKYGNDTGFDGYDLDGDGIIDADEFRQSVVAELSFNTGDINQDGKLSRVEWIGKYGNDTDFDKYDMDGDGIVDADEFRRCQAAEIDFGAADANHDGKVSREEWITKYGNDDGFDAWDLNGDGEIDADEFRECRAREIEEAQRKPVVEIDQHSALIGAKWPGERPLYGEGSANLNGWRAEQKSPAQRLANIRALLLRQTGAGKGIESPPEHLLVPRCAAREKEECTVMLAQKAAQEEIEDWKDFHESREQINKTSNELISIKNEMAAELLLVKQEEMASEPPPAPPTQEEKSRATALLAAWSPTFRSISPDEVSEWIRIEATAAVNPFALSADQMVQLCGTEPNLVFGAWLGDQMVGVVRGHFEKGNGPPMLRITMLVIDSPFRGNRISERLMNAFLLRARLLASHKTTAPLLSGGLVIDAPREMHRMLGRFNFVRNEHQVQPIPRPKVALVTFRAKPIPMSKAVVSLGIVANAQVDDAGIGIAGPGNTVFHRTPLRVLHEAVQHWKNADDAVWEPISLCMHVGEALAGCQSTHQAKADLQSFSEAFEPIKPVTIAQSLGGVTASVAGADVAKEGLGLLSGRPAWYELRPQEEEAGAMESWRCLVVDVHDRRPDGSGISRPQQEWLVHRLHEAQALGHAVVIAMHYAAVVSDTNALRQRSAIDFAAMAHLADIFAQFRGTIVAVVSGDSEAGFHKNIDGIDFIGIESLLPGDDYKFQKDGSFGEIHIYPEGLVVVGHGRACALRLMPRNHAQLVGKHCVAVSNEIPK